MTSASHQQQGDLDAELLADQVGQPLAGGDAHACGDLLHDEQHEQGRPQDPQDLVAVVRAGRGVGGDARRVVVHVGGDEGRANDGEDGEERQQEAPAEEGAHITPPRSARERFR